MGNIAIIPARGGSKRVPGKNMKLFFGKPMLTYSIQAALDSGLFEEVMVSTDSEEIAKIAVEYGATVPFMRSSENSDDYAGTDDVCREVLREYEKRGRTFEMMVCIYPCAPFVTGEKLRNAVKLFHEKNAEVVFPVVAFSSPPQWSYLIRDGLAIRHSPQYNSVPRSQDLEKIYHDCGQFYVHNVDEFMGKKVGSGRTIPIIMPETEVQDVDNVSDWLLAEVKYKTFMKGDSL